MEFPATGRPLGDGPAVGQVGRGLPALSRPFALSGLTMLQEGHCCACRYWVSPLRPLLPDMADIGAGEDHMSHVLAALAAVGDVQATILDGRLVDGHQSPAMSFAGPAG